MIDADTALQTVDEEFEDAKAVVLRTLRSRASIGENLRWMVAPLLSPSWALLNDTREPA